MYINNAHLTKWLNEHFVWASKLKLNEAHSYLLAMYNEVNDTSIAAMDIINVAIIMQPLLPRKKCN